MSLPNVVFVCCDTMSAFHLPYYGYSRETTPFISDLIEKSWVADFGYANAPFTAPSHASLFTGDLPHKHRFTTESMYLTDGDLLQKLQSKGYKTIGITNNSFITPEFGFSGWDLHKEIKDYEKFIEYPTIREVFKLNKSSTTNQLKTLFHGVWKNRDFRSLSKAANLKLRDYPLSPFPDAGAKVTLAKAKQRMIQTPEPFFLYLNFMEPHMVYDPPNKVATEYVSSPRKSKQEMADGYKIGSNRKSFRWEKKSSETIKTARALYDSSIKYLDLQLERLWEWIQANKQNTIFVLVSDHGELIGEHEMYGHSCGIWEKLLRVPIIIHGPNIQAQVESDNVALRDLYGFLTNGLDVNGLGKKRVFAEYYGYENLLDNENFNLGRYEESEYKYLRNRAKAVINGQTGVILNSHLNNQIFEASINSDVSDVKEYNSPSIQRCYEEIVDEFSIVDMTELSV